MSSLNRQVANQIVSFIDAGSYNLSIETERRDVPRHRAEDLKTTVKVDVFDIGLERVRANRNRWSYTVVMHMAVQFLPSAGTQTELDDVDLLRESIEDLLEDSAEFTVTKSGVSYRAFIDTIDTLTLTWAEKLRETGAFIALSELRWRLL